MRAARPPLRRGHTDRRSCRRGRGLALPPRLLVRTLLWMPVVGILFTGSPDPSAAQQPPTATAVVTGTVTGEHAAGLAGVEVAVAGTPLRAVTDEKGRFRIRRIPPGAANLEVRGIGYRAAIFPLEIAAGTTLDLELALEVDPVQLDAVEVRARAGLSPEMRGFYERRERGAGHFFTREEIGRMQSRLVTDVLRRVPGVHVAPATGPFGSSPVVQMRRATGIAGSRRCPVLYYVNGQPFTVPADIGINHFIRPDEIAGMEIYDGASRLPPRFHSSPRGARCGVIVIWTYAGEREHDR